ncbi:hypothetical protein Tco_1134782, partial [Tanacetum coccineum]
LYHSFLNDHGHLNSGSDALMMHWCSAADLRLAFQVTADAPEIYMQEFWASAYVHNRSVRFKMNNKKHIIILDQFPTFFKFALKSVKEFLNLPIEKEILIFPSYGIPSYDSLRLSQAQILWGMYNKKNVDYAYLLWEDFIFKIENKNTKKGNAMYYPRFTKLVVNFVMEKDPSIPRRNKYYAMATGTIPPKTKGSKKKANTDTITKQKPPTAPKEKKSGKGKQKTTELENISEADLTEAEQLKIITKRSRQETHSSHASGSEDDILGISDDDQDDEQAQDDEDADKNDVNETTQDDEDDDDHDDDENVQEDDDEHDDDKKAQDDDDEELTESDDDGDDFVHPKLTTHDDDIIHEEETDEDDSRISSSDDEDSDNEVEGANVAGAKSDEDATDEKDQGNEAVEDTNTDLDGRNDAKTDLYYKGGGGGGGGITQTKTLEDNFSKLRQTNQYLSAFLQIPSTVDQYLANKMQEAVDVAVQLKYDRIREESTSANQQFLDSIDEGMKKIIKEQVKKEVSKIIPKIEKLVTDQLESEVLVRSSKEANTSHAVAANLSELELKKILIDKMEANNSINRSDIQRQLYKALVDAYEADKILLDTYGDTVTIKRPRDGADDDQEPSAGTDRGSNKRKSGKEPASTSAPSETTTKTAGKTTGTGSKTHKKSASQSAPVEEAMQTTDVFEAPAHQEFETGVQDEQAEEEVQHLPDWFQQPTRLPSPDHAWNKSVPAVHESVQPWLSNLAQQDPRESFDELTDSTFDFSAFVLNRLNVQTLTPELLAGPTFELMKGTCKSLTELEYFCEEVYKATTEKLDWINPEGRQYPHDLRQPLPLVPNSQGRRVIPFHHFINNDLEYLRGGVSSRKYSTSVTKTTAADYGHIKWIEDLVPNSMWSQTIVKYDRFALWGISHWGKKRRQFYAFATSRESARDVYSKRRIIAVTKVEIVEWHDYKHLDWITVRRDDDVLYKFKEGDFHRLRIQDIEDMLLLLVQGKVTNLSVEERIAFNVSLRMFTRRVVIQRRVEDLQLGVESYQKKLNLTKPDTYRSNLRRQDAYTPYSDPRGFIYENKDKKNRLMRIDELHKFSDGTLDDVRTALNDRLKGIRMEYLPQTFWSQRDKANARAMIQAIEKRLKTRRIMRSLERFVGGRPYGGDLRLLQRTI